MNRCYLCGYTHFEDLKTCRARAAKKAADYAALDPFRKS